MEPEAQLVDAGDELWEVAVKKRKKKRRARAVDASKESLEMTQGTRHVRFHDEEQTEEEQAAEPAAERKTSTRAAAR